MNFKRIQTWQWVTLFFILAMIAEMAIYGRWLGQQLKLLREMRYLVEQFQAKLLEMRLRIYRV